MRNPQNLYIYDVLDGTLKASSIRKMHGMGDLIKFGSHLCKSKSHL